MPINVTFRCGGCDAEAQATEPLRRKHERISENYVRWLPLDIEGITPEGWVAYDPWTQCCYCPTCWDEIRGDTQEPVAVAKEEKP